MYREKKSIRKKQTQFLTNQSKRKLPLKKSPIKRNRIQSKVKKKKSNKFLEKPNSDPSSSIQLSLVVSNEHTGKPISNISLLTIHGTDETKNKITRS